MRGTRGAPGDSSAGYETREPKRTSAEALPSWRESAALEAITSFVEATTREGGTFVPRESRVAVFDNDGTLWCEKPMPNELAFLLQRLDRMARSEAALRERQPWKAAYEKDYEWLNETIVKHYSGDDSGLKTLAQGVLGAFAGWSVEDYAAAADGFVKTEHPTLGRSFLRTGYLPMVELLRYLEANGFQTYIASGGSRDFMRRFAQEIYGIPPERVIGSSTELRYRADADGNGGDIVYQAEPEVFDDGPAKPVRIWSRIGRRPILACGNSNGDVPMLEFAGGRQTLRLLVLHDDQEREFAYTRGAEVALARAKKEAWSVISMKNDWARVFDEKTE